MPLILGTNSIKDTSYDVANSLRFNSGSSDHLNRTTSSGDRLKWTWSAWIKKTKNGADEDLFSGYHNSSNFTRIQIGDTGRFNYINKTSGSQNGKIETHRIFKDNSAWYHFVIVWDSGNATAGNRMRIYVNGVEETVFANETQPSQDQVSHVNQDSKTNFVGTFDGSGTFFNGYMAEVVLVDGQALDPTSFGEFDSDSPTIWKPKNVSGLTFGTNGFHLDFENSSSLGADVSGQGNNFTVNNLTSVDQSTDTCTNNFATMNPLANFRSGVGFSEGNLNIAMTNNKGGSTSTFGINSGKWYVEMNITTMPDDERFHLGIAPFEIQEADDPISANNKAIALSGFNAVIYSGTTVIDNFFGNNTTRFDGFTGIIGMALDLDSSTKTITFSKAGAWVTGSGTTDTNFSNALKVDITDEVNAYDFWHVVCGSGNGSGTTGIYSMNFGSPSFSISSGNSDANGYGNFEYAVPSGYFALNTKNLAEYG